MTVIRTAPEGRSMYSGVVRRIAEREQPAPAPLVHFAGSFAGSYLVGTVFDNRTAMQQMFSSYTLPEAEREMRARGTVLDIAREEGELEHIWVSPDAEPKEFGFHPAGSLAACTTQHVAPSLDAYWDVIESGGWCFADMPGLVAHVAYKERDGVHAFDIWEHRAVGSAWYRNNLVPHYNRLGRGRIDSNLLAASWMELDSFFVTIPRGGDMRGFARSEENAVPA